MAITWASFRNRTFQLVGLAALLVGLALVSGVLVTRSAHRHSQAWMQNLQFTDSAYTTASLPARADSAAQRQRLGQQFREAGGRALMHFKVMEYFYARFYMALILTAGAAVVSAFCLFHISRDGWKNANAYIQVAFMVAAATALLLGLFPALFKQDANITDNKALYLQYVALGNEIQTYLATGTARFPSDTSSVTLPEFVWYVDTKLATLNAIPVGFDQSKITDYKSIEIIKPDAQ